MRARLSLLVAFLVGALSVFPGAQSKSSDRWIATWAAAPVARVPAAQSGASVAPGATAVPSTAAAPGAPVAPPGPGAAPAAALGRGGAGRGAAVRPPLFPNNQTLRQIVRVSLGGSRVRVVLSNVFGTTPLRIGAAQVGLRERSSSVVPGSARPLTFGGSAVATVPANAVLVSDPVSLTVPNFADLAIDIFIPDDTSTGTVTFHPSAYTTSYVSAGNSVGSSDWAAATTMTSWYFLDHVEVSAPERAAVVVMMGDSITDGTASTLDANHRWGDVLAHRLLPQKGGRPIAVVNAGIAANRVLSQVGGNAGINALARFEHDVLMRPGVQYVTVLEAINDIGQARQNVQPTADDLIGGHRQMIARAHALGLKIFGATLTPFEGAAYYTEVGEQKREAVNAWIRTGREYDGVIDFDAAVHDPAHPAKFLPQFDSGDHLHPSDAGYEAMGNAINLALFK